MLSSKQRKFVQEYLIDLNGTQAAIRAGYSFHTANEQAARLLAKVNIQEYLQTLRYEMELQAEVTRERILNELKLMLNARISDYLTFDGKAIKFKSFDDLLDGQIKAIEGIKKTRNGIEIKLHGKTWAIDRICKLLGFDEPEKFDFSIDTMPDSMVDSIYEKIINNNQLNQNA